jgi:hypothetical protein
MKQQPPIRRRNITLGDRRERAENWNLRREVSERHINR